MGQLCRVIGVLYLALTLCSCAGTSALESQTLQKDARLAQLYFLREKGVIGALGGSTPAGEIKVDGKVVGAVTNGSYIFVDRPAGPHKLSVQAGLSPAFDTE